MSLNKTARKILKYILLFALLIVLGVALGAGSVIIWNSFSKYHYNGDLYSDSEDYVNNYGYNYFKETNKAQEELYIEFYHVAKDFEHKNKNLIKGVGSNYGTLYKIYTKDSTLSFDELKQVFVVFEKENPEFYFLTTIHNSVKEYVEFEIHKDYLKAKERNRLNNLIDERMKEVDETVNKCTTTYDKVETIYNVIVSNMKYARDENGEPSNEPWAHNIIGFFERGEGVCETFSETFKFMLDRYGINNETVWSETHGWNIVNIDGYNYVFDLTNKAFGYSENTYFKFLNYKYGDTMYPVYNMAQTNLSESLLILKEDGTEIASSHSVDYLMSLFNNKDYELIVQNEKNTSFDLGIINPSYSSLIIKSNTFYDVRVYAYSDVIINKDVTFENLYIIGSTTTQAAVTINNATVTLTGMASTLDINIQGNTGSTLKFETENESHIKESFEVDTIITSKPLVINKTCTIGTFKGNYLYVSISASSASQTISINSYEFNKLALYVQNLSSKLIISNVSINNANLEVYYVNNTKDRNINIDINYDKIIKRNITV